MDDDSILRSIGKIVKDRVDSALGAGIEELREKGSTTVNVGDDEFTVSVAGKSSNSAPPSPPGGKIIFRTEGVNDVTFQMSSSHSVDDVEKFYRAAFAQAGLKEKQTLNADGLFKGEWTGPDGKPSAYVFAHNEKGGTSKLAVTLVKR